MNEQAPGMNQSQMMNQTHIRNQNYGMWPPPLPHAQQMSDKSMSYLNSNPPKQGFASAKPGRKSWKGKTSGKWKDKGSSMGTSGSAGASGYNLPTLGTNGTGGISGYKTPSLGTSGTSGNAGYKPQNLSVNATGGYKPPSLSELQSQNRVKARKFYPKKKVYRFAPFAPRNTTSYIIRSKKAGGIASLVSPCPVTPAVLPTPVFSPSREVLVDMAKEEWGVDGYGSMKGLIRLRSPGHEHEMRDDRDEEEEEEEDGSSESDLEEHVEVERRLDHDLSRFEMIYPYFTDEHSNLLECRVDDQGSHIAQLEEENLTLKEKLFLMESEMADLRRRLQSLEAGSRVHVANQEDGSDNDGGGDVCSEKSSEEGDGEEGIDANE